MNRLMLLDTAFSSRIRRTHLTSLVGWGTAHLICLHCKIVGHAHPTTGVQGHYNCNKVGGIRGVFQTP